MAINFNTNPYYDDFDQTKNFHRILFRPGYAVQGRELTQLQTQIQDQITKFGDNIFVNGTVVTGGGRTFENNLVSVKLEPTLNGVITDPTLYDGTILKNADGTTAVVRKTLPVTDTDPLTFIIKYISAGATSSTFSTNEVLTTDDDNAYQVLTATGATVFNNAMLFSLESGVFYIKGMFVYTEAQSIAVDKYSNTSSAKIGLTVTETITTSDEDESLLDLAQGSPNYTAPGADRYTIKLTLEAKDLDTESGNFIELARIVNGSLVINKDTTVYAELGKTLARRTFDESGDYTVTKWPVHVLEQTDSVDAVDLTIGTHYQIVTLGDTVWNTVAGTTGETYAVGDVIKCAANDVYSTGEVPGTVINNDEFVISLDKGKGYVKGFEFQTLGTQYITDIKGRDTATVPSVGVDVEYGQYINIKKLKGPFITNNSSTPYATVELHSGDQTAVAATSHDGTTLIGTANVRFVQWSSGTVGADACIYKMYLFNIKMTGTNKFGSVRSIIIWTNSGGWTITSAADIDNTSRLTVDGSTFTDTFLTGSDAPGLIYQLPNNYISSTTSSSYRFQRTFTGVSAASGVISYSGGLQANETYFGSGTLSSTSKNNNYIVVANTTQSLFTKGQIIDMTAAGRSITITGSTLGLNLNDGSYNGTVTITALLNAAAAPLTPRAKELDGYKKVVITNPNRIINKTDSLGKSDLYDILAIYNIGTNVGTTPSVDINTGEVTWGAVTYTNVTSNYTVDNGQRSEFYDYATLTLKKGAPAATDHLLVVYRNFKSPTSLGFSNVNSYSNILYTNIPAFTDPATGKKYQLRDCIDFRPRRDDQSGTAVDQANVSSWGYTFIGGQVPDPSGELTSTYDYYLGRFDKVIVTTDQQFIIQKGLPSLNPTIPADLTNGMTIYVLGIPPYTANVGDITIEYVDNKRYTMRDIGRLDRRIANLEYYTQLSLLEKAANDVSLPGADLTQKFKNGFAVDPFTSLDITKQDSVANWVGSRWSWWEGWYNGNTTWSGEADNYTDNSLADTTNIDFAAAVDPIAQELRAPFKVNQYLFELGTMSTGVRQDGKVIKLDNSETHEVGFIKQPLASSPVTVINPPGSVNYIGHIDLFRDLSRWPDIDNSVPTNPKYSAKAQDLFKLKGGDIIYPTWQQFGYGAGDKKNYIFTPWLNRQTFWGVGRRFKPNARLYGFIDKLPITSYIRPLQACLVQSHTGITLNATTLNKKTRGVQYTILVPGTTNYVLLGAANSLAGTKFIHNGVVGTGTGTVSFDALFDDREDLNEKVSFRMGSTPFNTSNKTVTWTSYEFGANVNGYLTPRTGAISSITLPVGELPPNTIRYNDHYPLRRVWKNLHVDCAWHKGSAIRVDKDYAGHEPRCGYVLLWIPGNVITNTTTTGNKIAQSRVAYYSQPLASDPTKRLLYIAKEKDLGNKQEFVTKTFQKTINFPTTGTYTIQFAVDNAGSLSIDGTPVAVLKGFTHGGVDSNTENFKTLHTYTTAVTAGNHTITLSCTNFHGPAGVAARILKPDSSELWTSRYHYKAPLMQGPWHKATCAGWGTFMNQYAIWNDHVGLNDCIAYLDNVVITGTAGQFSCTATTLTVGQAIVISGTYGGSGSITGYPTTGLKTYYIIATNGTTTFTLAESATATVGVTTTAGTPTGLEYQTIVQPGLWVYGEDKGSYAKVLSLTPYADWGDPLLPEENGYCAFNVHIPAVTTGVGNKSFRLIDDVNNDVTKQDSMGQVNFYANGIVRDHDDEHNCLRPIAPQEATQSLSGGVYSSNPIAETFYIDPIAYPAGVDVSSIDLYFAAKDASVPITVEIRNTNNGIPENVRTLPYASATLKASEVNTSTDSSVATTFRFGTSVKLTPGTYAIVLTSNSKAYQLYTATVGQAAIGTTATTVTKQPYLGSLWISQNSNTWQASTNVDMKFTLYYTHHVTILSGLSTYTVEFNIVDPISVIDYHTLMVNVNTILPTGTSIDWELKGFNTVGPTQDSGWTKFDINKNIEFDALRRLDSYKHLGNKYALTIRATMYSVNPIVSPSIDISTLSLAAVTNIINNDSSQECKVVKTFNATDVNTTSEAITVPSHGFVNEEYVIYSDEGDTTIGGIDSGNGYYVIYVDANTIKLALSADDAYAGTAINLTSAGTTTQSFTVPGLAGGSAIARYITKPVNLADGFDASNLNVTVDINKPVECGVVVYYKTLPSEYNTPLASEPWVQMIPKTTNNTVPVTTNRNEFNEVKFFPPGAFDEFGLPVTTPVIDPRFNAFQVKIVLLSSNAASTPRLRNLRIIALDS